MIGVHSSPPPHLVEKHDRNNGILQVVYHLAQSIREYGYEYVEDPRAASIFVRHAGSQGNLPVTVEHCHGLLPTAMNSMSKTADGINATVIDNIIKAKAVTVPSQWVADILRRDMRIDPFVIPWGINHADWSPGEEGGYVLWAKGRADIVCSPVYMNQLAEMVPNIDFISTFGQEADNVRIVGTQPFSAMRGLLRNASVYLATTRETWGIQTVEAMACGVPVLGFNWAATPDIVAHKVNGYLAEPGNIEDLLDGLEFCVKNRKQLGDAAIEAARLLTWDAAAKRMAEVFGIASAPHDGPVISVIIPCYNYARYVTEAIESVLRQNLPQPVELIVVNDGSTDNSGEVIDRLQEMYGFRVIHKENGGVSSARNAGFEVSRGEYVCFLDADDMIEPNFLSVTYDKMRRDARLGISYTALQMLSENGLRYANWPPGEVDYRRLAMGDNQVPTCCLVKREAFIRAGGYRDRFEPTEDGDLWARIVEVGYKAERATKTPLFTYRVGHASLSRGVTPPKYSEWHLPARLHRPPCALPKNDGGCYLVRDYDRPVVSIVVAHFSGEQRLSDTLDSLIGQTYPFWDCHLVYMEKTLPDLTAYPFVRLYQAIGTDAPSMYRLGVDESNGPLIILVESGTIIDGRSIEDVVRDWQEGQRRAEVLPRVWYTTFSETEKRQWLALGVVAEASPKTNT